MPSTPPTELLAVATKVDRHLDELLATESRKWSDVDPRLAEAVDELHSVLDAGGKRLRAAFCYWAWRGVNPDAEDESVVIDVGAAFELLQTFALIHDDIMDDSATRRGRPTIHTAQAKRLADEGWQGEPRRFGEGVAILIGDLSHAYADRLLADAGPSARRVWDDLRIELNLGQYLDLRSAAAGDLDRETALRVSTFKSALYTIVRPLQLGANLTAPAPEGLSEQLEAYGRPLGRAFQLKDDLLGLVGDEEQLGKPVGDDLREGKPTELLALAVGRADAAQAKLLSQVGERDLNADDVANIVEVLRATGAVADIENRITALVREAVTVVPSLPFESSAKKALSTLADYVAARNS